MLGSGHPLGDIFLLKHDPTPAELTEGVAFYGRVGQAVLKSVQRLDIDPLLVYGTNVVKLGGDHGRDERELAERVYPMWLLRELHIVQPKILVVMGEDTLAVVREVGFCKVHVFSYSPRAGTPAAALSEQVTPRVVAERCERLRTLER